MTREEAEHTPVSLWHLIKVIWILAYFLVDKHEKSDFKRQLLYDFDIDYTAL